MADVNDIKTLFHENYAALLTLAIRLVHDRDIARDMVHEVFARLLESDKTDVNPGYLMTGVRFACHKYIRNLSIHERIHNLYSLELETSDDELCNESDYQRLNSIISDKLSANEREVIRLRFFEHKTYKEIAEALLISEVAVYKRLRNAITVLRQNLSAYER